MKKEKATGIILCLLTVSVLIMIIWSKARTSIPMKPDSKARNFTLTSSTGKKVSLSSFKGKSIVVMAVIAPYT